MAEEKDRQTIINRIRELINNQQNKMDGASVLSPDIKCRSEGYLEALYHVENILINF